MGWDAYATRDGKPLEMARVGFGSLPADPQLCAAFLSACDEVKRRSVSGTNLGTAILGGPFQAMFERGTGQRFDEVASATGLLAWTPEKVRAVQSASDWAFDIDRDTQSDEPWEYWTARLFLETCAANGLGVLFTW